MNVPFARPDGSQPASTAMLSPIQMLFSAARNDLATFVALAFSVVDPGARYLPNWHIRAITHQLERVLLGHCKPLIITMPPRSLKSVTTSVAFPAWVLGRDPSKRMICVSYAQPLAVKLANDFRTVVDTAWYRSIFPTFKINPRKNTENEMQTTLGGGRLATSTGGQLTGRGGDIIIIDDPLKADEAHSESARSKCAEWVRSTLMSRFDNPAKGAAVLVMQRLHVDDLAGILLEAGGWEHLNLSAIAEQDERIQTGKDRWHDRKIGDLLHPSRYGMAELDGLKLALGSLNFSAQFQQAPAPPDGNIVKRAWFRYYDPGQLDLRSMTIVQSWDTAVKGDPSCDYSVGTTWAKDGNNYYLLDLVRVRAAYPELIKAVKNFLAKHDPEIILIEDAGSGSSLIADLDSQNISTTPIKTRIDKESRLSRVGAMIENGNVHLPKDAHWKDDFLVEVLAFPNGKHDDQVDSMTQALIWMKDDKPTGRFYVGTF
ncbi:phage terminase large subunit [Mesorhizobium sp. BR1-1-9]|uniref:phage terminase large subunit n=1 Tax=Mesorhizobium sp. BR1-1-9 TaxID=2876646 RepID=UPI001CD0B422|nr:phage terminase large subunit [Mesorhizobium sp. BR1-1-9]MBZ9873178.1 phage terminase large subunit [Mesorhizobium sp. BR1-1-9]